MKKIFKNKIFWIAAVVIILGIGGFALVRSQQDSKKQDASNNESSNSGAKPNEKTDNPPAEDSQGQSSVGQTTINTSVSELAGVSLTAYLNREATTSQDGKTTIPADSISISFYMPVGVYSIQKLNISGWQDVATNNNYSGHGGLSVPNVASPEDNISYRVIKIENGTAKSVSKTFIVKRSDLSGGIKTYN